MRYRLCHQTTYSYAEPVVLATHFLHLMPRQRGGQKVHHAELTIAPSVESRQDEQDYFGNPITTLNITAAHRHFSVTLHADISVQMEPPPPDDQTPPWEKVAALMAGDAMRAEFALPSALTAPNAAIAAYARESFLPGRPVMAALRALNQRLFTDLVYRPGSTGISTTAAHVLKVRNGVCQDYAHVMLACLRALGLAGRYVSGYLRTLPPEGGDGTWRGADQSHAWISAWIGSGWVDLDPTNNLLVSNEHVTLAWGRDYADISPVRGIILGGGQQVLHVSVALDPRQEAVVEHKNIEA